ncbi:MAG TPA: copper resistance CopC family protein [Gemmatimonadaceae bacterium]|nr:copper resistance CopC family protein [Gemmatimonadaceae bacterium]
MRDSHDTGLRTRVQTMKGLAATIATVAACVGIASGFAAFHTHLKRSDPGNGATLGEAPKAVQLWFTEKPELAATSVMLSTVGGSAVALAPLALSDGSDTAAVVAVVRGTLAPGSYVIRWRTMARDGHPARGTLTFTLSPAH